MSPSEQQRQQYLEAMGIPLWVPRPGVLPTSQVDDLQDTGGALSEMQARVADRPPLDEQAWDALIEEIRHCENCALCQTRTQAVPGVGNRQTRVLVIGEAPGADEDRQGEPFVGRAGKLLDEMLLAIGFNREDIFIANILKCRPPNNRDPHVDEIAACHGFLQRQIALIQPELILSVGRISAQSLLHTQDAVGKLRGKVHQPDGLGVPVVVTYHPAYLLRKPSEKRKAWSDLKIAIRQLRGE